MQNDGKGFLLNDGKFILLNVEGPEHILPGQSGGRVRKRVGRQLVQGDLGPRPEFATSGESLSKIVLHISGLSKSKLHIISRGESSGVTVPYLTGYSNGTILIKAKHESKSQLLYKMECESWGVTHSSIVMERANTNQIKIAKIHHYMDVLKEIDKMDTDVSTPVKPEITMSQSFTFVETHQEWLNEASQSKLTKIWFELSIKQRGDVLRELGIPASEIPNLTALVFSDLPLEVQTTLTTIKDSDLLGFLKLAVPLALLGLVANILKNPIDTPIADIREQPVDDDDIDDITTVQIGIPRFRQASSFVGEVQYSPTIQSMTAELSNITYIWCNVPQRIFDGWKGASSKGAFFNRAVKGQFDC